MADQAAGGYTDADITGRIPMARFASPDDIANAVAFLADDEASGFINGHALAADGGWTADGSWESLHLRHRRLLAGISSVSAVAGLREWNQKMVKIPAVYV